MSSVEEVVGAIKHAQEDAAVRVRSGRLPVQLVTPFEFEVRQCTEEVPASAIGAIAVDELTDNAFGLTLHADAMTGEDSCLVEVRDAGDQAQERMLISSPGGLGGPGSPPGRPCPTRATNRCAHW